MKGGVYTLYELISDIYIMNVKKEMYRQGFDIIKSYHLYNAMNMNLKITLIFNTPYTRNIRGGSSHRINTYLDVDKILQIDPLFRNEYIENIAKMHTNDMLQELKKA